jgi:hypothetical protein
MTPDGRRILKALERHKTFGDLSAENFGADLCEIATDGCAESLANQVDPTGKSLPALSDRWVKRKGHSTIGVWLGLMSDPVQMAGEVEVTRDSATVTYGVTEDARAEADWFTKGDPKHHRPPRPFWGLTIQSLDRIKMYVSKWLKRVVG